MAEFDFQQKLLDFYPKNIDSGALPGDGEIKLPNLIKLVKTDNKVIDNALKVFKKFLRSAFDITSEIDKSEYGFSLKTVIEGDKNHFKISFNDYGILVSGNNERSIAQGVYYLEFLLFERRAPILKIADIVVEIPYSPRIVHSGYAHDEFPDEYLLNIARYGIDAIAVYAKGVNLSKTGEYDFSALSKRAKNYGIDVYLYLSLSNFIDVYSDTADIEFDKTYGAIVKSAKGIKGIVLVGESVEFKSRDERVANHSNRQKPADNIKEGLPTPGWFPCNDYPFWLEKVKRATRKYNPDLDVVFWTYNWGWVNEKDRLALIENLPKDVSLNVTFEMFDHYNVLGSEQTVTDYTIARAEAGKYFISEAKKAKSCGISLYSMTNSLGRTWDFGVVPYMPFPNQWLKRFDAINSAKKLYNLKGLMETHHYGFYPNFIARLNQLCYYFADDLEENLKRVYNAYFENSSKELCDAFEDIGNAITYLPPSVEGQYGPLRVGTAYPLCLISSIKPPRLNVTVSGDIFWAGFYGQFEENMGLGYSDIGIPYGLRFKSEVKMLNKMLELLKSGIKKITNIENKNKTLLEVLNLLKYINCCVKTFLNAKRFYEQRVALKLCDNPIKMLDICKKIRKIAEDEIKNAEQSINFLKKDSSLGFEPSMGYVGGVKRVEWKIKQVKYMISNEVSYYENHANKCLQ